MIKNPNFFQRLFFIAMSIFLMWQSYVLVVALMKVENLAFGVQVAISFLINLFFTGVFAFAGFALPTEKLMPQKYYEIRSPKKLKNWFGKIGGEGFRKFLLATFWRKKENQKKYFDGKISGIEAFETATKKSEFGHLIPFFCITVFCIFLIKTKLWVLIFVTMAINIFFNFYPIILQRHHRSRLIRIKNVLDRKKNK